jgi:signal transduction histidine kinase
MTNNEPEFTNLAGIPAPLCFFYDLASNEIPFSSSSLDTFFETEMVPGEQPPFLKVMNGTDPEFLINEWQHCLQLNESEIRTFTFAVANRQNPLLFSFMATKPASSVLANSSLLIISVTKAFLKFPSPAENQKVSSINNEYAEFMELAVHDLDSPLRKLSILLERITGKIENDTHNREYVLRSQACLSDMRSLIDSLALLGRLTGLQEKKVYCDLESIIQKALKNLENLPGEKKVILIPGSLPVLEGDITQYKQLFNRLLENTFKFKRQGIPIEVKILSEVATDEEKQLHSLPVGHTYFKITVSDNGIGFKQDHAEKIFQPFVRLNGKSEYTGSGIGLAICKKIVENHCGIIYAESKENFGATFTLFLPLSPY